jgi:hypothetical protein
MMIEERNSSLISGFFTCIIAIQIVRRFCGRKPPSHSKLREISDDLNNEIDKAAAKSETIKSEIFLQALTLYLAMYEGRIKGRKAGLVDPDTQNRDY